MKKTMEPIWCVVANIADMKANRDEPGNGTKHFKVGAKVYLWPPLQGDGYEQIKMVGRSRGGRWISIYLNWTWIRNARAKVIYEPAAAHWENGSFHAYWKGLERSFTKEGETSPENAKAVAANLVELLKKKHATLVAKKEANPFSPNPAERIQACSQLWTIQPPVEVPAEGIPIPEFTQKMFDETPPGGIGLALQDGKPVTWMRPVEMTLIDERPVWDKRSASLLTKREKEEKDRGQ